MAKILLYGAYGYSGDLIVEQLVKQGIKPILAGRNAEKVAKSAKKYGITETSVFSLDDTEKLEAALANVDVCFLTAGPFSSTMKQTVAACIKTKTHYMDINGMCLEIEEVAAMDKEAKAAGITLMPASGFDTVGSDCLLAHTAKRVPQANELSLYIDMGAASGTFASQGTLKSVVENADMGQLMRKDGKYVESPNVATGTFDFGTGNGPTPVVGMPWGDLATAYYSTKVPNISVYFKTLPMTAFTLGLPKFVRSMIFNRLVVALLQFLITRYLPPGPDAEQLASERTTLFVIAKSSDGVEKKSKLVAPNSYAFTGVAGAAVAKQVLSGKFKPGFQTASMAFGPEFITTLPGCEMTDL